VLRRRGLRSDIGRIRTSGRPAAWISHSAAVQTFCQTIRARHSPKPIGGLAVLSAMGRKITFVAILDKGADFARGQGDRAGAVDAQLHQAAIALRGRTRDRAGAEQIPGGEFAAVAGVMRDHLRHGPIEIVVLLADMRGGGSPFAEAPRHQQRLRGDIEVTFALIGIVPKDGGAAPDRRQDAQVARRGNGASASVAMIQGETVLPKLLPGNGPSGLRFPLLDVARRPVVEKTEPE